MRRTSEMGLSKGETIWVWVDFATWVFLAVLVWVGNAMKYSSQGLSSFVLSGAAVSAIIIVPAAKALMLARTGELLELKFSSLVATLVGSGLVIVGLLIIIILPGASLSGWGLWLAVAVVYFFGFALWSLGVWVQRRFLKQKTEQQTVDGGSGGVGSWLVTFFWEAARVTLDILQWGSDRLFGGTSNTRAAK